MTLYPLIFEPILKDYIWGGRNLESRLGRHIPADGTIAESWEISGHADGTTTVQNGPLAGQPLTDLLERFGLDLIGRRSQWALDRGKFPLLIKILDANRPLSVQVHPDDQYALKHEGNELGKTEMWVILHAEPGAEVILGVSEGSNPADFRQALTDGHLEPHLHRIPVKTGDHINVPAGSLHAIMDGLLIAEIQQNSNTTYRVYDWNRLGADGQPRPLHIDKALNVINFEQVEPAVSGVIETTLDEGLKIERLNQNRYFTVERVSLSPGGSFHGRCEGETFEIWGVIEGDAMLQAQESKIELPAVRFTLLPAVLGDFTVSAGDQETILLRAFVE